MPMVPDWTEEQHQAARDKHAQEIKERKKTAKPAAFNANELERLASELGIEGPITVIMCDRRGYNG